MESIFAKKPDVADLEEKVKKIYRDVALNPKGEYHFEMGRELAEKLGYEKNDLEGVPSAAMYSFAGVGLAALKVGKKGNVFGVDMTNEQLEKAERLRKEYKFENVFFHNSYIENLPFGDGSFDVVISNGVINLCPDKEKVFAEVSRVLKPGGGWQLQILLQKSNYLILSFVIRPYGHLVLGVQASRMIIANLLKMPGWKFSGLETMKPIFLFPNQQKTLRRTMV
jgi:SAM-dependent methyltransferase